MKIFRFIKKVFFLGLTILSNFTNALDCISMKNQECKVRPEIININSNNPIFYPFSIKINKCSGNCNNINNPYAKICVSDVIKDLNNKVFDLMSRTYEYKYSKTKVREYNGEIKTNFLNNGMPKENLHYSCIACVTIDSVINFNKKNYPQVYLEECKYRIKKTQIPIFIKNELKSDSDSV